MRHRWLALLAVVWTAAITAACATAGRPGDPPRTTVPSSSAPSSSAPSSSAPSTSPVPSASASSSQSASASPSPTSNPSPTGLPSSLLGQEWSVIPTTRRVVALTFDAGANDAGLASVLATLRGKDVLATFFLTGGWVRSYPSQARAVCAEFRVGNHSATHPHFTELSQSQLAGEVLDAAATIRATCGADPAPLFRFPFGDRDARTIAAVNALGYVPVRWTVDTLGWQGTSGGRTVASVVARVLDNAQPGEIVLMHVGSHPTDHSTLDADALPQVIDRLRARGYDFVTLDALISG